MTQIVVQVSDARASADKSAAIVTYSLGSCIGAALYDPVAAVGGMLHHQLPSGSLDPEKASRNPCMFADTGLAYVLAEMERLGANRRRIRVRLAGGAAMLDASTSFAIGKRNHAAIRKALFQHGLFVDAEEVGGSVPRTMTLQIANGEVSIRTRGESHGI
ncbi:chemotaxis protein CheD [Humisphaera borealis]|uniref:Probable chemoreceptor glutamine deamidase CheD n=1 Tax=Humisphaera borealis TaxID=2807512 RepID=A0A7M2X2Q5_9BACT|nr:chemotaxis protein CheD [Humisphaera borealis]QOV91040.1 chemotaxis protein CheD [Humisphaera borealis]